MVGSDERAFPESSGRPCRVGPSGASLADVKATVSALLLASLVGSSWSSGLAAEVRCGDLLVAELTAMTLPRAFEHKEHSRWVEGIWTGLRDAAESMGGAEIRARLAVLPPTVAGRPIPPTARSCPAFGTVYLSHDIVTKAYELRRAGEPTPAVGEDMLAFVIAHELAHWRFDHDERALGANACPTVGTTIEADADLRAVFLMALARRPKPSEGRPRFDPAALRASGMLTELFVDELGWPADCEALRVRLARFDDGLRRFADFHTVFDIATVLAFAADADRTTVVLSALESLDFDLNTARSERTGDFAALPELRLLRAIAYLERAAATGDWVPSVADALEPSLAVLRFVPLVPARPALSMGSPRARPKGPTNSSQDIAQARRLLDEAGRLGVSPAAIAGARAMAAFLEGAYDAVPIHLSEFELRLHKEGAAPDRDTRMLVRDNLALVHLTRRLSSTPHLPLLDLAAVDTELTSVAPASPARRLVVAWRERTLGDGSERPAPTSDEAKDRALLEALETWSVPAPGQGAFAGRCLVETDSGCSLWLGRKVTAMLSLSWIRADASWGGEAMLIERPLSAPSLRSLVAWRRTCHVEEMAVSSAGERVHRAICLAGDTWVSGSWLLWSMRSDVARVVRLEL